jgi:hypothetical protein
MADLAVRPTRRQRLKRELVEYAAIVAYLWACFGALAFYRAAILEDAGVGGMQYGAALLKALILGKFMLLGHAAGIGEHAAPRRPLNRIVWRSLATLALLVALTVVEHLVKGLVQGETPRTALVQAAAGRWPEIAASCLLLWMILVPWFGYREIAGTLGEGELRRRLLTPG